MKRENVVLALLTVLAVFTFTSIANSQNWSYMSSHSDGFNDPELDPKWSFDNPATNQDSQSWSLISNPGFLGMTTTGPTDLCDGTNTSPKMLETSPAGDFRIVARVLAAPDIAYEHAGIIVMQSTSWIRFIRDYRRNSLFLQSSPCTDGPYIEFPGTDAVLRLTKTGYNYEAAFSTDSGQSYTVIGNFDGPANPTNIGVTIASTPSGNMFTAEFDYFKVYSPYYNQVTPIPGLTGCSIAILVLLIIGLFVVIRKRLVSHTV